MNLIADTNVWYDIGAGRLDPAALKAGGHRLVALPFSCIEIASKFMKNTDHRRNAAQAVAVHADEIEDESDYHVARLWGLTDQRSGIDWDRKFKALAQALSESDVDRVFGRTPIAVWRAERQAAFESQMISFVDMFFPGYEAARANKKHVSLGKEDGLQLAASLSVGECRDACIRATFDRALSAMGLPLRTPTNPEIARAEPLIAAYVDAYIEYCIRCSTIFAPQPNDFGDLELFVYLQHGNCLLSLDDRWRAIATKICPTQVYDLGGSV